MMYTIIIESNSGHTYVYGTFKDEASAQEYLDAKVPERSYKSATIVLFLPAL